MKTIIRISLFFIICLLFLVIDLGAQVPGYFNYQAVIKDAEHNPLKEKEVSLKFTITQDTEAGKIVYSETQGVISGKEGTIAVLIGNGDQVSGSLSDIDWGSRSYYLSVEIDPENGTNYTPMGVKQLVAVPYAMHAGTVDMPVQNIEVMEMEGQDPEEALFEVKRADGSTVFAVYNEGVRIYVDDSNAKSTKGGFAVGGYKKESKGYTNEYLRVTPDSVRVYVKTDNSKAIKGGFAVGGYKSANKEAAEEIVFITRDSTRINVNMDYSEGVKKGGFSVGGYPVPLKGESEELMTLDKENYFIGHNAGASNTSGLYNSFIGYNAGALNTEGSYNSFLGYNAGYSSTNGSNNIFMGQHAGYSNLDGYNNLFIGDSAGYSNTSGRYNVFMGSKAGESNDVGFQNISIGYWAGRSINEGNRNIFIGTGAGLSNDTGVANVFIGNLAGQWNTKGNRNVFLGSYAGHGNLAGDYNIFLGNYAGSNEQGSNKLVIENSEAGENEPLIYGDFQQDLLEVNAELQVRDLIKLQPRIDVPLDPEPGTIYFDGNDNTLKAWDGDSWRSLW